METTRQKGAAGEDTAEKYLRQLGYEILTRNASCRYGEIDLVAQRNDRLFFVEIKRRVGSAYGSALEAVSTAKQNKIRRTAEYLLSQNPAWQKLIPFFSVIAIDEDPTGATAPKIEFLPDAFY